MIVDSADHASILDGALLSRAKMRPFRHNRLDKLERALERAEGDGGGVLVVVDGVFSMEGDVAPLVDIVELCARYGARLMVDEAHGAGVLGARGAGTSELLGVEDRVDLRMGTFSKSLAACGGFVAGPAEVIEYLRIYSRAFLFTASAVPAALGAALAALRIMRSDEGPALFAAVLERARYLADGLQRAGLSRRSAASPSRTGPGADAPAGSAIRTPIVPVLVGDDWKAALLWRALYDGGRVHQLRPASRGAARRRAAAHERDGHPRRGDARPRARGVRARQARVRVRARTAAGPEPTDARTAAPRGRVARPTTCPFLHKSWRDRKSSLLAYEPTAALLTADPVLA